MKAKSIFAASLLVTGVAFADSTEVTTSYTLGVMPVSVTNETIIAIPWVEAGGSGSTVAVTNLVKTATLEANTTYLYWYNPEDNDGAGAYYKWKVVAGAGGVKYWSPITGQTDVGNLTAPANSDLLKRGQAAILKRADNCTVTNIYLVGQYADSGSGVITTVSGPNGCSPSNPCVSLIAPPVTSTTSVNLNAIATWGDVSPDDVIIFGAIPGKTYQKYVRGIVDAESKWGVLSYKGGNKTFTPGDANIVGGTGFWYLRAAEGDVTITWN